VWLTGTAIQLCTDDVEHVLRDDFRNGLQAAAGSGDRAGDRSRFKVAEQQLPSSALPGEVDPVVRNAQPGRDLALGGKSAVPCSREYAAGSDPDPT
jgi:hypothetical protein